MNEANLASDELKRQITFKTKLDKKLDPFEGNSTGKTEIKVRIQNQECQYFYEWEVDKFQNRLFMIRDLLEELFETGEMPVRDQDKDPFWDPPNPILIGQSFL